MQECAYFQMKIISSTCYLLLIKQGKLKSQETGAFFFNTINKTSSIS
jgi:hypothetical protein